MNFFFVTSYTYFTISIIRPPIARPLLLKLNCSLIDNRHQQTHQTQKREEKEEADSGRHGGVRFTAARKSILHKFTIPLLLVVPS
jgi:hypothetical protein